MQLHHLCLAVVVATAPVQTSPAPGSAGQTTQKPAPAQETTAAPKIKAEDLPVDIDRIQRALADTPRLRFDKNDRPVFRVEVFGKKPTIDDILGPDWAKGPVKGHAMTHQEFLDMVTPEGVRGYEAFTNKEGATVAATSLLLQWTLQKAIAKFNETRDERAREAARQEVVAALNALEEARAKAGLPRK